MEFPKADGRGNRVWHMVPSSCVNMRRHHRPNQRPLSERDALCTLMRRVLESAASDADFLKEAAGDLLEAKRCAKNAIDALHSAMERFVRRLASMRRTLAWVDEPEGKEEQLNSFQFATGTCEISPERFRQAMYDKLHQQTLDELLRRPGYVCSACGHIHT